MDTLNKTVQYSHEDLQASYMLYYRLYYPIRSKLLLILGLVIFVLSIFMLLFSWTVVADMPVYRHLAWFFMLYAVVIIALHLWRMKTIGKRLFKKIPDFESPYSFTFSEKGIITKGASISTDVEWSYYVDAAITPDLILLLPNKLRFNLFPKKYFTDDEFQRLTEWAKRIPAGKSGGR